MPSNLSRFACFFHSRTGHARFVRGARLCYNGNVVFRRKCLEGEKLARLILASASPRRAQILRAHGLLFETAACPLDETPPENEGVRWRAAAIARQKARYVAKTHPNDFVLGADTIVCLGKRCLGKPHDEAEAAAMLESLSDRTHAVVTGVCLIDGQNRREVLFTRVCDVTFAPLSPQWISDYIATGEPMDKAGAYAIQGGAREKILRFTGDFDSIVGLPTDDVIAYLQQLGFGCGV